MKKYYVYIATNKNNTVLYTGMSNEIERRIFEHTKKLNPNGFTSKYNIQKLIYYDTFLNPADAIISEKKIKGWTRKKKIELIEEMNPNWKDLLNK